MENINKLVDEITKQQLHQSDTDKFVQEQKKIDEKIKSLVDYKDNETRKIVENLLEQNTTDDIADYQNSPYYKTYLYLYDNMENIIVPAIKQIEDEYRYMESVNYINDDTLKRMNKEFVIPKFALSKEAFNELLNKINEICDSYKTISDIKLDTDIEKIDYTTSNNTNIVKHIDGYKIIINVKRQEKIK